MKFRKLRTPFFAEFQFLPTASLDASPSSADPCPVIHLVAEHGPGIDPGIVVLVLYLVMLAAPFVFGGRLCRLREHRLLFLYGRLLLLPLVLGRAGVL